MNFGDIEPEDSWDGDDPIPELLRNIVRRLVLVVALRQLSDPGQFRLEMIEQDLRHVIARLEATGGG